jgi:hypothetical protein
LLGTVFAFAVAWWSVPRWQSFLQVNAPVQADVLIVEGWTPDYVLEAARAEFVRGGYRLVVTSGGPLEKGGFLVTNYHSYAQLAAQSLVALGIPSDRVVAAPAADSLRHRTYLSAVAVRAKLTELGRRGEGINVFTEGAHGRRTWNVYRKAMSADVPLGIISCRTQRYEPERWYATSAGVKDVLTESLGWFLEATLDSGR